MATNFICSVDDCGKTARNSRGWCNAHYLRWRRYGDPTAGRINHGDAKRHLNDVVLPFTGKECLIWPHCRDDNGYARYSDGLVHTYVCERRHGKSPSRQHQAAHSCGNGHLGCVSPEHLAWKTVSENQMDRVLHGTSNRGSRHALSKLTEEDVAEIMAMKGKETQKVIAAKFGVSRSNISAIHRGTSWDWR
jgi:hypothetical protein